jgi:uncharacterized protein (TIGR03435 family)
MNAHVRRKLHSITKLMLYVAVMMVTAEIPGFGQTSSPQAQKTTAWQIAAGGKMSFDVASVRQNKSDGKASVNVDILAGDTFSPTGGLYLGKNIGLPEYISFAYKLPMDQFKTLVEQVPWLSEDRFDIEARASGNPTKDQYRLMMQSLLAERFKFAVHYESRQVPIFGLVLAKSGKLGPQLRLHSADDPVCANPPPLPPSGTVSAVDAAGYPVFCDGLVRMKPTEPGRLRFGGRNLTMAQIAASPMRVMADVGRPLVDQTGIKGTVDFTLEWALAARNVVASTDFHPDESAPEFDLALAKQLGIKLQSQKGPVEVFVIDHIEHPSEN